MGCLDEAVKDRDCGGALCPLNDCRHAVFAFNQSDHLVYACLGTLISECAEIVITIYSFFALRGCGVKHNNIFRNAISFPAQDSDFCFVYWCYCGI